MSLDVIYWYFFPFDAVNGISSETKKYWIHFVFDTALGVLGDFLSLQFGPFRETTFVFTLSQGMESLASWSMVVGLFCLMEMGVRGFQRDGTRIALRHAGYIAISVWFILGFVRAGLRIF